MKLYLIPLLTCLWGLNTMAYAQSADKVEETRQTSHAGGWADRFQFSLIGQAVNNSSVLDLSNAGSIAGQQKFKEDNSFNVGVAIDVDLFKRLSYNLDLLSGGNTVSHNIGLSVLGVDSVFYADNNAATKNLYKDIFKINAGLTTSAKTQDGWKTNSAELNWLMFGYRNITIENTGSNLNIDKIELEKVGIITSDYLPRVFGLVHRNLGALSKNSALSKDTSPNANPQPVGYQLIPLFDYYYLSGSYTQKSNQKKLPLNTSWVLGYGLGVSFWIKNLSGFLAYSTAEEKITSVDKIKTDKLSLNLGFAF